MDDSKRRKVMFYKDKDMIQEDASGHDKSESGLDFNEFQELDIKNGNKKGVVELDPKRHLCDLCVVSDFGRVGVHLCYFCSVYMCELCYAKHDKNHLRVKVKSERKKRVEKAKLLLAEMRSDRQSNEKLDKIDTHIRDRISVQHLFDNESCWITGLCGLENTRLAIIDNRNYSMKIFNTINNTLLRYIRFGSAPRDVTRIRMDGKLNKTSSASEDEILNQEQSPDEENNQSSGTLAITFPKIKQIWILDTNTSPLLKTKTIEMDKECYEIEYNENKFFTLCAEEIRPRCYSVDILSLDGQKLQTIYTTLHPYMYDLAVSSGRVYLTDWNQNKIYCMNADDGEMLSEIKIEGSEPTGISVDQISNTVYVSAWEHDIVYELDSELKGHKQLVLKDENFKDPSRLGFHRNKLFVSHRWPSDLSNLITVIQLS